MATQNQAILVQTLFNQTLRGTLAWERTLLEDVYQATFSNGAVRVSSDVISYSVSLLNKEGKIVDTIDDTELSQARIPLILKGYTWYTMMKELYEMARRNALGADQVLTGILGELKSRDE